MEYAFKNIESLIGRAISSAQKSKKPLHEQFARVRKAVADEKAKAETSFAMQAVALDKGEQVTRYVHYHQNRLINFIDELFAGATISTKRNSALVSEILLLVDQLKDLLEFVERNFEPFFNRDAKFPDPHRTAKLKALANQHKRVQDRLSNLGVGENLKSIISNLINETMISQGTTYRRMFLTEQRCRGSGFVYRYNLKRQFSFIH